MEISMMIKIRLEKNSIDLGSRPLKCESQMRELEQILSSKDAPMELICQSVGLSTNDRDKLDLLLLKAFLRNVPPNYNLLNYGSGGGGAEMGCHRDICTYFPPMEDELNAFSHGGSLLSPEQILKSIRHCCTLPPAGAWSDSACS